MHVKIGSCELEVSRHSLFLGINLGRHWRYQTFRDWSGHGLTTEDWTDRRTGWTVSRYAGDGWEAVKG
ncbi:hypothetical protein DA101_011675 [Sinorhizobium meliloti]|nr:hypothetical protein DA101_011675 [Sinorhizobium meliloti]